MFERFTDRARKVMALANQRLYVASGAGMSRVAQPVTARTVASSARRIREPIASSTTTALGALSDSPPPAHSLRRRSVAD